MQPDSASPLSRVDKLKAIRAAAWVRFRDYLLPPAAIASESQREDTAFMPHTVAALFQRPPPPAFLIVRGTLLLLVVGIAWASLSSLDEITVGEGKIIPSSQVQVVQNLEGGIVAKILVKVGDLVQKDQVVVQLDETRFASSVGESKAKNNALQARVARLNAEASGIPFQPSAELIREDAKIAAEEQSLFNYRQRELEAALSVLRQQVGQRSQEISEKRARLQQLQESHSLVAQELKMSKPLLAQGALSEVEILRIERQVSDLRGEMEATRLALPRLEAQLAEARSKLEGQMAKFRSDAANELAQARADFAGTSASSLAVEDRLARTAIRTPLAGIVKQIKVTTVGGVIQPGMEVMEIVPLEDNLLVEARIRPSDVGFLRPGLPTLVKISAYDFSIYGGLEATVENITADSITNEKGESFYLVRVRTARNALGSADKALPIIPGMLATVHIRTGEKSVMSYLLKPVIKAKHDALRER
jgi:adhesin transport system membrane fusion protein